MILITDIREAGHSDRAPRITVRADIACPASINPVVLRNTLRSPGVICVTRPCEALHGTEFSLATCFAYRVEREAEEINRDR